MSPPARSVVIVGGGASGTLAAIRLAAHASDIPRRITVVEPAAELGLGAAYGTPSPSHLLNVRASGMSALAEEPGHFLGWAQAHDIGATEADFLPRMHYGRYLRHSLDEARRDPVDVAHLRARAVSAERGPDSRLVLVLDEGRRIDADDVVLATGNAVSPLPGSVPGAIEQPRVVSDPWRPGAVEQLRDLGDVLIVGTGLTAVDVVLTLRDVGHAGRIRMVSSHGLLPESHAQGPLPPAPPFVTAGTPEARSVRAALAAARAAAVTADDWRQVVDGFRGQTVAVWRGLPDAERRRFLRHLARRWEVRRHRMAPQIAAVVADLRAAGRLVVERGRVSALAASDERIQATVVAGGVARDIGVDAVVVCTGPSGDPRRDPFLARLIDSGLVTTHPLGIGIAVDDRGRALGADGTADPHLWTIGTLRRGADWESTAVPDLRVQARDLAWDILGAP